MKTLYIDSRMGISGQKLLGALIELTDSPEIFVRRFNELGFDGIRMERSHEAVGGVSGALIEFKDDRRDPYEDELDDDVIQRHSSHHHKHRKLDDVKAIIDDLPLGGRVRKQAIAVYNKIAESSAQVKGKTMDEITLNRTGSRDIIASVVAVCMLMDELGYEKVLSSPIATGTGYAYTSRGQVPIPIPALQAILDKIPYSNGAEEGEICTLEGAALLKVFADSFGDMPELNVIKQGAGFGHRTFKTGLNCVRVYVGEEIKSAANGSITELEATLYSDNAQSLLLASERLEAAGVTDAYTVPIASLRGGRGFVLKCICPNECADAAAGEILRNTSATAVRRTLAAAYETEQRFSELETSIGKIGVIKTTGFGIAETKLISGDVAKAARENNLSYNEAYEIAAKYL